MNTNQFQGFRKPKANYFSLPNEWTDIMPEINSLAELKVILYVLRHTWGFHDPRKKITIDEFMNGRRRIDRTRMDKGTGLSKRSVRLGLEKAIGHGFLIEEINDSDKGRIKKRYHLNLLIDESDDGFDSDFDRDTFGESEGYNVSPRSVQGTHRGIQSTHRGIQSTHRGIQSTHRTEKDTNRKTPSERKKKGGRAKPSQSSDDESGFFHNGSTRKKRRIPAKSNLTEFDIDWGNRIRGLMVEHDTDLSNGKYKTSGETFAKQIRKLRISRKRTESEITEVLGWYTECFAKISYPKLSKASDLCDRFQAMCDAKETSERRQETAKKNGEIPKDKHSRLSSKVASICMSRWETMNPTQDNVDTVLEELGHPAGMFDARKIDNS
ncbi:hypothetical protein LCGC14_0250020 [marine sediment metagenome]|uniref:Bacteriophage lambda Replication protein O N-terminal domain-containing protein n=1 Tax=marine sediment metagenome TaxID=412755 RepID=A0A0F9U9Y3_9ZZZZ